MAEVAVGKALLTQIFKFTINLLRIKVVNSIAEGDISLDYLRTQLQTEFEKIHDKLNKLMIKPLRTAKEYLHLGMAHIEHGDRSDALHYFRIAEQNAIDGFTTCDYAGKLTAVRIRMLCAFHIHGYFTDTCNVNLLNVALQASLNQLVGSTEFQTALKYGKEGRGPLQMASGLITGTGNRVNRLNVLSTVTELRSQLTLATNYSYLILSNEAEVDISIDIRPIKLEVGYSKVVNLYVNDDILYVIQQNGVISMWDMNSLTRSKAFQIKQTKLRSAEPWRAVVHDKYFFAMPKSYAPVKYVEVWNTSVNKFVRNLSLGFCLGYSLIVFRKQLFATTLFQITIYNIENFLAKMMSPLNLLLSILPSIVTNCMHLRVMLFMSVTKGIVHGLTVRFHTLSLFLLFFLNLRNQVAFVFRIADVTSPYFD